MQHQAIKVFRACTCTSAPVVRFHPFGGLMKSFGRVILKPLYTREDAGLGAFAIFLLLAVLATLPIAGIADVLYGTLIGTVTDKTGAVVPGVTVTVTNQGTGAVRTAVTGAQGDYLVN